MDVDVAWMLPVEDVHWAAECFVVWMLHAEDVQWVEGSAAWTLDVESMQ